MRTQRLVALMLALALGGTIGVAHAAVDLLITSANTEDVRSFDGETGAPTGVFAPSGGGLWGPRAVAINPLDDDIYVCDWAAAWILRFDGVTGCFEREFVPAESGGLVYPVDLAFGSYCYVVCSVQGVLRYEADSGDFKDLFIPVSGGGGYVLDAPSSVVVDSENDQLLISDMNNGSVLRFDVSTGDYVGYLVPPYYGDLDAPREMVIEGDYLYVSNLYDGGAIHRYDRETRSFEGVFVAYGDGGMGQPEGIAFGPDGNLYVSDTGADRVLVFDGISGSSLGEFIPTGSGGLDRPYGLVFGADDDLYLAAYETGLMAFDGQTGDFIAVLAEITFGLGRTRGIAVGPDNNVYIGDEDHDVVRRYEGETGCFIDNFTQVGSGLVDPRDLLFAPDGAYLFVVGATQGVLRYDGATGTFIDLFVPIDYGNEYVLDAPYALAFGPDDNLYVTDMNNGSVVRFDGTTGGFIDYFVSPYSGGLDAPRDIEFGADGHLYVSNLYDGGSVHRFDGTSGGFMDIFVTPGSGGLGMPEGLTFGSDGNLYIIDYFLNRVLCYDGTDGSPLGVFVTPGNGGLNGPLFMLFNGSDATGVSNDHPWDQNSRDGLRLALSSNPFHAGGEIRFAITGNDGPASLRVYDVQGRVVRVLATGVGEGSHQSLWDGRDRSGERAASGVYFLRLATKTRSVGERVTLIN